MPNSPYAFLLFLSSYSPAFLILAIRSFDRSWTLFVASAVLFVISVVGFIVFLVVAKGRNPINVEVESVEPRQTELAAYVVTYILPFLTVTGATWQDVLALGLFLIFIGLLWVRSAALYLNPLLVFAGYSLSVAVVKPISNDPNTLALPKAFFLSRKQDVQVGDEFRVDRMGSQMLLDVGKHDGREFGPSK